MIIMGLQKFVPALLTRCVSQNMNGVTPSKHLSPSPLLVPMCYLQYEMKIPSAMGGSRPASNVLTLTPMFCTPKGDCHPNTPHLKAFKIQQQFKDTVSSG